MDKEKENKKRSRTHDKKKKKDNNEDECMEIDSEDEIKFVRENLSVVGNF